MYVLLLCQATGKYLKICYYWTDATMKNHLPKQNIVVFLSQTGQSTTTWWWTKMLLLWLNSKMLGEHFTIWLWWATVRSFSYTLSKPYSPSFVFCCVGGVALHKKWSFSLRISFVNVTKSTVSCGFGQIYWRNL